MAEITGLLNRRTGQTVPGVRIPPSPLIYFSLKRIFVYFCAPREVVQLGRIHGLGPWGRRFESCPPDYQQGNQQWLSCFFIPKSQQG